MSDFEVRIDQRRRLLQGDYRPLVYEGWSDDVKDPKPSGCEPGARYVLAWQKASATAYEDADGGVFVARVERRPVWFLTVKSTVRRPQGGWLVRFDITDLRDRDDFLRPGGGYQQGRDPLQAGRVPDPDWLDSEAEAISEHWEQVRLDRLEGDKVSRLRARSKARRKRAA